MVAETVFIDIYLNEEVTDSILPCASIIKTCKYFGLGGMSVPEAIFGEIPEPSSNHTVRILVQYLVVLARLETSSE